MAQQGIVRPLARNPYELEIASATSGRRPGEVFLYPTSSAGSSSSSYSPYSSPYFEPTEAQRQHGLGLTAIGSTSASAFSTLERSSHSGDGSNIQPKGNSPSLPSKPDAGTEATDISPTSSLGHYPSKLETSFYPRSFPTIASTSNSHQQEPSGSTYSSSGPVVRYQPDSSILTTEQYTRRDSHLCSDTSVFANTKTSIGINEDQAMEKLQPAFIGTVEDDSYSIDNVNVDVERNQRGAVKFDSTDEEVCEQVELLQASVKLTVAAGECNTEEDLPRTEHFDPSTGTEQVHSDVTNDPRPETSPGLDLTKLNSEHSGATTIGPRLAQLQTRVHRAGRSTLTMQNAPAEVVTLIRASHDQTPDSSLTVESTDLTKSQQQEQHQKMPDSPSLQLEPKDRSSRNPATLKPSSLLMFERRLQNFKHRLAIQKVGQQHAKSSSKVEKDNKKKEHTGKRRKMPTTSSFVVAADAGAHHNDRRKARLQSEQHQAWSAQAVEAMSISVADALNKLRGLADPYYNPSRSTSTASKNRSKGRREPGPQKSKTNNQNILPLYCFTDATELDATPPELWNTSTETEVTEDGVVYCNEGGFPTVYSSNSEGKKVDDGDAASGEDGELDMKELVHEIRQSQTGETYMEEKKEDDERLTHQPSSAISQPLENKRRLLPKVPRSTTPRLSNRSIDTEEETLGILRVASTIKPPLKSEILAALTDPSSTMTPMMRMRLIKALPEYELNLLQTFSMQIEEQDKTDSIRSLTEKINPTDKGRFQERKTLQKKRIKKNEKSRSNNTDGDIDFVTSVGQAFCQPGLHSWIESLEVFRCPEINDAMEKVAGAFNPGDSDDEESSESAGEDSESSSEDEDDDDVNSNLIKDVDNLIICIGEGAPTATACELTDADDETVTKVEDTEEGGQTILLCPANLADEPHSSKSRHIPLDSFGESINVPLQTPTQLPEVESEVNDSCVKNLYSAAEEGSSTPSSRKILFCEMDHVEVNDKNFIRVFIEYITNTGIPMFWHKEHHTRTAFAKQSKVITSLRLGSKGCNGKFTGPSLHWATEDLLSLGEADVFDIRSIEKASALDLTNYPLTMPTRCIIVQMHTGEEYVFEAADENAVVRFVHGMRWIIARLAFNLIIGNLHVGCQLLDFGHDESLDSSAAEGELLTRAMNDVTNHLVDHITTQKN